MLYSFHALLGTGPATYRTESERSTFLSDIDGLKAYGPLNPDCSESTFTGMLNAFNQGPAFGSSMFVFTDASAKDADSLNKVELKGNAAKNDVTITFFTHLGGCSNKGIKDYEEIAKDTGGKGKFL